MSIMVIFTLANVFRYAGLKIRQQGPITIFLKFLVNFIKKAIKNFNLVSCVGIVLWA